jgi:hypothetical protein
MRIAIIFSKDVGLSLSLLYGKGLFSACSVFWPFPSTVIVVRGTGQKPETPFIQKIIYLAPDHIIQLQF